MKTPALQIVMAFLAAAGVLLHSLGGRAGVIVCIGCEETECLVVEESAPSDCCAHEEETPEPCSCIDITIKGDTAPRVSVEKDRVPALELVGAVIVPAAADGVGRGVPALRAEARAAPPPREAPSRALILLV